VMARLAAMRGELAAARQARTAHADSTAHTWPATMPRSLRPDWPRPPRPFKSNSCPGPY